MKLSKRSLSIVAVLSVSACGGGGSGAPSDESHAQKSSPPAAGQPPSPDLVPQTFVDVTASSGIAYAIGYRGYLPLGSVPPIVEQFATGGVASGDYDLDGDIDLFITRGDIGPNLLYRNNGSGVFTDVADAAGLAFTATRTENYRHSGPTFADMDGDGDLDLFIGGLFGDPSLIYANNGDGTFRDVTAGSGIDTLEAEYTISAAFGDYDLDGDLDLFLTHWGTVRDSTDPGDTEHLWRNDSYADKIIFTSVSEAAQISPSILTLPDPLTRREISDWSFTPTFARIDDDLYPDIVVTADFNYSQFFHNNRDGTFTNATDTTVLTDSDGMGSALGDFDNDGDLDWFVTSIFGPEKEFTGNRFYRNDGGVFVDRTTDLGVIDGSWGWGACFLDFQNDGDLDIYHTNGWALEGDYIADSSRAFVGSGGGPFVEDASALGLADTQQGRGIVCADFDNDGDVDILQLHRGSPVSATLWRNDTEGNNFLEVILEGSKPNTEAVGARIYVTVGSVSQMREIRIGNNFVSQNPTVQIFGLGNFTQADEVTVQWPDGQETIDTNVAAGQVLTLSYADR